MRKIALLLFLTIPCFAQVNISIPNANGGNIASEEWVKTYFNGWLQRSDVSNPPTDPVITPDPVNTNCPSDSPTLNNVINATSTSLTAIMSSAGVTNVNWYINPVNQSSVKLKEGNLAFSNPLNISWAGELEAGTYVLRIQATNCTGATTMAFEVPVSGNTKPCLSAPVISSINSTTRTSLNFTWSGLNVPEIVWKITQNNNVVRQGSFTTGVQTVSLSYAEMPYGTYQLQLTGIGCSTVSEARTFTLFPPSTTVSSRHVYMNFTGYGFDVTSPTGLNSDWTERAEVFLNMNYQGVPFKGIDGIRVNMKWFEYEPTEGNFRDDKLIAAINWCIARGIKLSINLVPWRRDGDNFIPVDQKTTLANGQVWYERPGSNEFTYLPSMNSAIGRQKFKNCARHLSQIMKSYPQYVDYISCTTGQTEEFYLAKNENPIIISGYSKADLDAWATYSNNQPAPRPPGEDENAVVYMLNQPIGKLWYEFQSNSLRGFHAAFVQGVREGGGARACGMYAGAGAPADAYNFMHKLNTVFSAGTPDQPDIIYSSEGTGGFYNQSKLMATDLNIGTFPGAKYAIEFDPEDVQAQGISNPPYFTDVSSNILYEYGESFFRRGGEIILFAMSFHPQKIPQLTEACYKFKVNFMDTSNGMNSMPQGESFVFPITNYTGTQTYRFYWQNNGGGFNKQVKFTVQ